MPVTEEKEHVNDVINVLRKDKQYILGVY